MNRICINLTKIRFYVDKTAFIWYKIIMDISQRDNIKEEDFLFMDFYKDSANRSALAREIAREGIVLLKNEGNMLPFGKEKVAVFGRTQVDTIKCGTGSAFCKSDYCVNVLEGMENAGICVDEELAARYRAWCAENLIASFSVWGSGSHVNPEMPLSEDDIKAVAERTEKAVFVIGRTAGENDDTACVDGDFLLSPDEAVLLDTLKKYYKNIAIIVNSGNLIDFSFTECEEIKAVILLNLPGMEGGNALGDILSGKYSPSGRITDTIARHYSDYPSSAYFGKKAGTIQNYYEDIFVGYRYFETFKGANENVLYPFGHGLSYTNFSKTLVSFDCGKDTTGEICVKVLVKNIGDKYCGKETVMLFSSSPESLLGTPKYELRAFKKTKELAPGEEELLTISYPISRMASFDDDGKLGTADAWVMAKGSYGVYFGSDVEHLSLAGDLENPEYKVIKKCAHIPTELEKRLTIDGSYEKLDAIPPDITKGILIGPFANMSIDGEQYFSTEGNASTYKINVTNAGTYKIQLCADTDIAEVQFGGRRLPESEKFFAAGGAEMILPPATCEFTFIGTEKAPKVSFNFEKEDDTIHISAEGSSIIEGGKFSECALYVIASQFEDKEGKLTSGKGLFRMHTPGRNAMYKLEVEKAGFYDVTLRYTTAKPSRKLEDTYSFMVSNVTQEIESVDLPQTNTEEKRSYNTTAPIRLALPAGEAYLKVVSLTTDTPLLAYMELTPSTREVHLAEKKKEQLGTDKISDNAEATNGVLVRKTLPPVSNKYDFRNVLSNEITLDEFIRDLSDEELAALTCGNANGQIAYMPERGIPESYWSDGPVGFRQEYTVTVYPSATMVAATWNEELAYRFGRSIGTEANLYNVDVWLAPAMNIHRDPCCGRNFEYLSEDPYITAEVVSSIVKGVQEFDVATTIKHFAANNTEYQRMKSNSRVSARAMREIYMKAFELVVEKAEPYSIMTSYNHINGIKVSENPIYCTEVLRNDFGFKGMIMSDFANDSDHVRELIAKQDLKMHFGDPKSIVEAMNNGTLSRDSVRGCVAKILELLMITTVKNENK